jgi:hypothetical protein
MNILAYTFLIIVFIIAFFKIEIYFIHKSCKKFKELKQAYRELKEAKKDLYNILKTKEL